MRPKWLQLALSGAGRGRDRFRQAALAGLAALAAILGVIVVWLILVVGPRLFVPSLSEASLRGVDADKQHELRNERLRLQNDVRTTLVQGIGGAVVVLGVYLTSRQLRLNKEGQIAERFSRAVEQLGSKELAVRVGGIAALGRIASDSPRDHERVMETLAAFIREQSRINGSSDSVEQLSADLQIAATVLGERPEKRRGKETRRISLRSASLGRVHLREAHYERVALTNADLPKGQLTGIHLDKALLRGTCFKKAVLEKAHFKEAFLLGADFQHARLAGATFDQAWIFGAKFDEAQLEHNTLDGAYCDESIITYWMRESLGDGLTWAKLSRRQSNGVCSFRVCAGQRCERPHSLATRSTRPSRHPEQRGLTGM
jgi:uncharacterized protein YjbI with pentapeptide repeats